MKLLVARRPYRQTTRAAAAEATRERILDAFLQRMRESWFDEVRLEDVARDAGVTVQTVIRRFGGKDGLLAAMHERAGDEIRTRRAAPVGDVDAVVRALSEDYEAVGDLVMRLLAQEDRYPVLRRLTDAGRLGHRSWVHECFAPWLLHLSPEGAERTLDRLVVATDLYVWKLLRRDMGRPIAAYQSFVRSLIHGVLAEANTHRSRPKTESHDDR
jgi:AcrR family transcriptional regulator